MRQGARPCWLAAERRSRRFRKRRVPTGSSRCPGHPDRRASARWPPADRRMTARAHARDPARRRPCGPGSPQPDRNRQPALHRCNQVRAAGPPRGRHQYSGRYITRLNPIGPRQPRRGQQRALAGQQHDLVHGDRLGAGRARDGHRPPPAPVSGMRAGKVVADHPLAFGSAAQIITDSHSPGCLERRLVGELDGCLAQSVDLGTACRRRHGLKLEFVGDRPEYGGHFGSGA